MLLAFKTGKPNFQLICYTDADFGGDLDTRKSRSGYIFLLNESPVTWASQRQQVVAVSITGAQYIALSVGVEDILWLRRLFEEGVTIMKVDDQSAIKLANNPEFHKRTKHIDIKYHFVREASENGAVKIDYGNIIHN
ncbi:hypothetical protein JTB14_031409 [Gonioctena quinquepunctata]|nr:hypothetical protein JTB14_031409 [Gonioctena quinquepunctata]